jgi:hypothetical protein
MFIYACLPYYCIEVGSGAPFTHVVAIFVIGGVFDRTRPEIVQYDCDSVLSERPPCIFAFDSETYALSRLTVRDPFPARAYLL